VGEKKRWRERRIQRRDNNINTKKGELGRGER